MSSPYTFEEEVAFWSRQVKEHMMILNLGIVDVSLKQTAAYFETMWATIVETRPTLEEVNKLLDATREFQENVMEMLAESIWIGWLSYSFLNHITMELNYFTAKVNGAGYNMKDELDFWLWHDADELAGAEKLVDPTEEQLSATMKAYIAKAKALRAKQTVDDIALAALAEFVDLNEDLKDKMEAQEVLTNIPFDLVEHVIREGDRSLDIFEWLVKQA